MKIRLSDEERDRYGCPEELDCSIDSFPVREAEALEEATGMEPFEALKAMMIVREPHPDDDTKIRWRYTPRGVRLLIWLGLWRAGITVPFDELDFDYARFSGWRVADKEQVAEEGKDDSSREDGASTPSTSATSSPRTKPRTSKT